MKNYIIRNATVYKRTAKTQDGERTNYWAMAQLTSADPNDPTPNTPPVMAITNDIECQKFWKYTRPLPAGDARLNRYKSANSKEGLTITAQEFDFEAAMKDYKEGKLKKSTLVFDTNTMEFVEKTVNDPFFYKANVNAREVFILPPGNWGEIATTDRVITLANGTPKPIKAGDLIVGKTGQVRLVSGFTMAIQYAMEDGEWKPVDDVERMKQTFIESHFRRIDQPVGNTPGAPTTNSAEGDVNAEEAAKQAEAEKAAAELSGGLTL